MKWPYRSRVEPCTFSFVDLAGYTAASWMHGDDVAARLAIRLRDLAHIAQGPEDLIIKSIGDAVMCHSPDPQAALEWQARLFLAAEAEHQFPHLRAGCHHGPSVEHEGDYYGTAVNIAARVAALAEPCELLATEGVAAVAGEMGWALESRGAQQLRNIAEPIRIWAIAIPTVSSDPTIDPVCHMRVAVGNAAASVEHVGRTWLFCSAECRRTFVAKPAAYIPDGD